MFTEGKTFCPVSERNIQGRVPMPPGNSWIFSIKFPGPGGRSWKMSLVLESPEN